jgi:hypothetical protein
MLLCLLGVVGTLFLLAFGLWLTFLFLLAAFLVSIAEAARPSHPPSSGLRSGSPEALVFPALAFAAVAFLLISLVVTVLL